MENPYKVLGISAYATKADAKKAYRALSKKYHPDTPITGDEAKFKEVDEAWKQIDKYHVDTAIVKKDVWRHVSFFRIKKEV